MMPSTGIDDGKVPDNPLNVTWSPPGDQRFDEYLRETPSCDIRNPNLQRITSNIIGPADSPGEAAVRIFYFVRDEIKHGWVPAVQRASMTLERKIGDCWPKSILQVAMLRAARIPARFRWIEYHKQLFLGLVPTAVYDTLSDPFPFHVLAEVYLDGRWVKADATFDRYLSPARTRAWDGRSDSICLNSSEISKDRGATASFEDRVPEIEEFFGGPLISASDSSELDLESEIVNMSFELVRFRNSFEQTCEAIMRFRK